MRRRARSQSGSALVESAMFAPILIMLLMGTVEIARVAYTYHSLHKMLYTLARYVGTQQGVNFCDEGDATILAAKNYAVTGTLDGSTDPLVLGMTADRLRIRVERYDAAAENFGECDCSVTGCDTLNGARGPDFIVADIPDGYSVRPVFYGFSIDPFLLRPTIRVPYGGT